MDEPDRIFFNFIRLSGYQLLNNVQKLGIVIGYLISHIKTDELLQATPKFTGDSEIYKRPTGNFIATCDFIVVFVNYY